MSNSDAAASRGSPPPGPSLEDDCDPTRLGWMRGFPPEPDKAITFADGSFRQFPQLRWSWSNIRQLVPTVGVWRGAGPASPLPRDEQDLGAVPLTTMDGRAITVDGMMQETYTDGMLVLHRGRVAFERYRGALEPHRQHIAMSVTKSFTGTLAGLLAAEAVIDPDAPVTTYVPELSNGAFGDATVRHVMNMTTALRYSENYTDPRSDVWAWRRANGMAPPEPGAAPTSLLEYLTTIVKDGEHGRLFAYRTANTDVLAWCLRRATGKALSALLSERIWQPIRAEEDAYFSVDRLGIESAGGGLNATLRDLARFGELMRNRGVVDGRRVIPDIVFDDILRGGDRALFAKAGYSTLPDWSYCNQWWIGPGVFMARGIHGQAIYVDPSSEVVIARFASHPVARNAASDPVTLPAYRAIVQALAR